MKYDVNTVNSSLDELVDHVGTPCGRGRPVPGTDISSLHIVLHTTLSCNGAYNGAIQLTRTVSHGVCIVYSLYSARVYSRAIHDIRSVTSVTKPLTLSVTRHQDT